MAAVFGMLVFAGAFAATGYVFVFTLVPALPRIAALLRGEADPAPARWVNQPRVRTRARPATTLRPASLRAAA